MFIQLILTTLIFIKSNNGLEEGVSNPNHRYYSIRQTFINESPKSKLETSGVVPDVIDTAPTERIRIRYPSGVEVNFGNELTPFTVKDEPTVNWGVENGNMYTLIMTDPDVPNRVEPTLGQVKHWLVINIPGNDLSKGLTLASYRGSAPPEGSGLHRYIFLVYKQPGHLNHSETHTIPIHPENRKDRIKWNVREFARKYNLGEPIASNFYQAQSDPYTRQLWAKWNRVQKPKSAMEENSVVPDVIDIVPHLTVQVKYPNGVEVNFGNELTPFSVKDEPTVDWPVVADKFYTLIMTDPDAPSRKEPTRGEIKHWLVVNIPGTDISKGQTLAGYRGSGPSEGSGLHRYIFLVYQQPSYLSHSEKPLDANNREGRTHFKVRQFAKRYNLGQPYAGNFYQAQSDEYSKQRRAKMNKQTN